MTHSELINIIEAADPKDWVKAPLGLVYKHDVALQIIEGKCGEATVEQAWLANNPDAQAVQIQIRYGFTEVAKPVFAVVGDYRFPFPDMDTNEVELVDYQVARLIDTTGNLEAFLDRSGITVAGKAVVSPNPF